MSEGIATHYNNVRYIRGSVVIPAFNRLVTFTHIYQARPDGCRFAIGRALELAHWVCWDMHDALLTQVPASGRICAPAPLWTGPSEAALVMRAIHHV